MRRGIRSLLVLCAVPSVLLGQTAVRTLHAGERVRITAQADTGIYIIRAMTRDTLAVQQPPSAALVYFPLASLRTVEISRGAENRGAVAGRRAFLGLLGGATIGGLLGYMSGDDKAEDPQPQPCNPGACVPSFFSGRMTKGEKAGLAAAVLGGLGFLGGALSGLGGGERWERVPLPPRVSVSTSPNGVFALSYTF